MKYLGILFAVVVQVIVMAGDALLFGVCIAAVSFTWLKPVPFLVVIILISLALGSWNRTGAFEAWNPKVMKAFIKNVRSVFT